MIRKTLMLLGSTVGLVIGFAASPASANDRHFGFSYESAVLAPGARELEVSSTFRTGRGAYYSRFDHRFELEVGLVDRLQTALYLNASATTAQDALGNRTSSFSYRGISSEWKLKLFDPVADPIGIALYGELTLGTDYAEIESKVILDKRVGGALFASNLVAAREWSFASSKARADTELEARLATSYFVTHGLALGLEGRVLGEIGGGELEFATTYVGPVIAYAQETWWAVITPMRQLPALKREDHRSRYITHSQELWNVRLIVSFHL